MNGCSLTNKWTFFFFQFIDQRHNLIKLFLNRDLKRREISSAKFVNRNQRILIVCRKRLHAILFFNKQIDNLRRRVRMNVYNARC